MMTDPVPVFCNPAAESPETANGEPMRITLSRAKGWRMPANTLKVDRSTKLGNVFIVGRDGTAAECVDLHIKLMAGFLSLSSKASIEAQEAHRAAVITAIDTARGKNVACWCRQDKPCHGDTLLKIFNHRPGTPRQMICE